MAVDAKRPIISWDANTVQLLERRKLEMIETDNKLG